MSVDKIEQLISSDIAKLAPWLFVPTKRLATTLDIHPQTFANWRHRGVGPQAAPADWFKGRAIQYPIGHVLSWAYESIGVFKEPWEVHGEWLRDNLGFEGWANHTAVMQRVNALMRTSGRFRPSGLRQRGKAALGL